MVCATGAYIGIAIMNDRSHTGSNLCSNDFVGDEFFDGQL